MKLVLKLVITLALVWLLLSGMFKTLLLGLGAGSVLLVAYLSVRMQLLQHRGQPVFDRLAQVALYWGWLTGEIIRSNIAVARTVLDRELPIDPVMRRVSATPKTEIGRVIYANSITLTPGTTAINFTESGKILVHALHASSLDDLERGEMAHRIQQIEADGAPPGES